jgi:hypothetical protein
MATCKEYGHGARLDNGSLVLSKIGRLAVRWSRPIAGTSKTVTVAREADGWDVCCSCADVPGAPLPRTGQETGIDLGLTVFLVTAEGDVVAHPRHHRRAERALLRLLQRVFGRQQGRHRRKKAASQCAKPHQHVRWQRRDVHHQTARALVRQYDPLDVEALPPANLSRRPAPQPDGAGGYEHNGASRMAGRTTRIRDAGWGQFRSIPRSSRARQQAPGSEWQRSLRRLPHRIVQAASSASSSRCACAGTSARPVAWFWTATSTRPETATGAGSAFRDSRE